MRVPWPWCVVIAAAPPVAWWWAGAGMGLPVRSPAADLAWLVLLAAAEETVFRGGLQEWLLRRPPWAQRHAGLSRANIAASGVFAALHAFTQAPWQVLALWPVSLQFGLAYEQGSRRLARPIALHLWFNLCLYAASALQAGGR